MLNLVFISVLLFISNLMMDRSDSPVVVGLYICTVTSATVLDKYLHRCVMSFPRAGQCFIGWESFHISYTCEHLNAGCISSCCSAGWISCLDYLMALYSCFLTEALFLLEPSATFVAATLLLFGR